MNKIEEKQYDSKKFSVVKRIQSFSHAGRGLWLFAKNTHNAWVHFAIFFIVIVLGFYFNISSTDWVMLILASGFVFTAEAFNTAIEIDIDLTSPDYHPYAKDTKDVAAGAVLISAVAAAFTGALVFYPYVSRAFDY